MRENNSYLKDRWVICRLEDKDIDPELEGNPFAFSDGEIVALKAILLAAKSHFEIESTSNLQETAIAKASQSVIEKFTSMVNFQFGEKDECSEISTPQGGSLQTPDKSGSCSGGTGAIDGAIT